MTKLMGRIDSAATRGARKQSVQARASTVKASKSKVGRSAAPRSLSFSHGHESGKVTVRSESAHR
jgi:hypothetical protein